MDAISGGYRTQPAAGASGTSSEKITLQSLQKQYPELKISEKSFKNESGVTDYVHELSGKYHVTIDPAAIARMNRDPAFAKKMHENLSVTKKLHDERVQVYASANVQSNAELTVFNADGRVIGTSSTISYDEDGDGRPDPLQGNAQGRETAPAEKQGGNIMPWNVAMSVLSRH